MVFLVVLNKFLVKKHVDPPNRLINVHPVFQSRRNKQDGVSFQAVFNKFGGVGCFARFDPENGIKIVKMRHKVVFNFLFIKIADLPYRKDLFVFFFKKQMVFQGCIIQLHEFQSKDPLPGDRQLKPHSIFLPKVLPLFRACPWADLCL